MYKESNVILGWRCRSLAFPLVGYFLSYGVSFFFVWGLGEMISHGDRTFEERKEEWGKDNAISTGYQCTI